LNSVQFILYADIKGGAKNKCRMKICSLFNHNDHKNDTQDKHASATLTLHKRKMKLSRKA